MQTLTTIFNRFSTNYFFSTPPETQIIWFWLGFFVLLLIVSSILYFLFRAKAVKQKPYKAYAKIFFWPNFSLAIIGIIFIFSRYEGLSFFSWRFWAYVTVLFVVVYNAWFFVVKRNQLEDELIKFYDNERRNKWLNKAGNKKNKSKK